MNTELKRFTTGEIITAAIGRLVCPIERVYEILNYLTGDNLYTHQLPRAGRACAPWLKQQFPWLKQVNESTCNRENWETWLAEYEARFGLDHEVKPMPTGQWQSCDPVQELVEITEDRNKVIVITT